MLCFIIIWPKSGSNSCQSHITHFIIVRSPVCLHETMQIQRLVALLSNMMLSRRMSAKQFSPLSLLWYSFVCIFLLCASKSTSSEYCGITWHMTYKDNDDISLFFNTDICGLGYFMWQQLRGIMPCQASRGNRQSENTFKLISFSRDSLKACRNHHQRSSPGY